jgi:hypothetical protein
MSLLLEKLMDRVGRTKVPRYAKESLGYRARIQETSEFKRIKNIPREKIWQEERKEDIKAIVDFQTMKHKKTSGSMELWPIQAVALFSINQYQGAFLPIGVGQGKALISLLAAQEIECERPVLFVPAQLRDQTLKHVIPEMKKHWNLHPNLRVIGYSELSLAKNADMLEEIKPDLIIGDEIHSVKNPKSGRTRRLTRYFKAHPETKCVAMSGTISSRSIVDWTHIAHWCLRERTPVPLYYNELQLWADCVDEKVPDDKRVGAGALEQFCKKGENVRQGFRRRFVETPGVVASRADELGVSLRIFEKKIEMPQKIRNIISDMKNTWMTPQGDVIAEAVSLWRHIRELSLGFWYRWDPEPPRDWLDARKAWKQYVRETLKNNHRGLDTELQVWNEIKDLSNHYPLIRGVQEWREWKAIKDTFRINSVPVWESDFVIDVCKRWLDENRKAICWVEHRAFGERLAERCTMKTDEGQYDVVNGLGPVKVVGLFNWAPYFGAGDNDILDTKKTQIIASIGAHSTGKNLQRFNKNLVVCPMASGKDWEQLLARTHRPGQEEDVVTCEMFLHIDELKEAFAQARADALYLEDTYGNRQKLNYADIGVSNA